MRVYSDNQIEINTREEFEEFRLRVLTDVCRELDKNPLDESLMADLRSLQIKQLHLCQWIEGARMMEEKRKTK
tara:strand:+ start:264 stop:482 length:219 start_codon:yes stop_codon:yes gene_type:complete